MNLYCNVAPLRKERGRGRKGINYTLTKMYNRFEIENCCFSMQSGKPQLIAFLNNRANVELCRNAAHYDLDVKAL